MPRARRSKDTVENSYANLDCVCREKHFLHRSSIVKKPEKNRIESVIWPGGDKRWLYPPLKRQSWMTHEIYALKIRCAIFKNSFFCCLMDFCPAPRGTNQPVYSPFLSVFSPLFKSYCKEIKVWNEYIKETTHIVRLGLLLKRHKRVQQHKIVSVLRPPMCVLKKDCQFD